MYLLIAPPRKIRKTDRAMEEKKACNLDIGLGVGSNGGFFRLRREDRGHPVEFHLLFPLHPKEEISSEEHCAGHDDDSSSMAVGEEENEEEEEGEEHNKMINIMLSDASKSISSRSSNDNVKKYGTNRKKLKLSKEQLALLEDYFNSQSTLNLTQKQELALRLNLQPRQVEVWFQNRRARTKQKQVERNCEFWKKCCDNLSEENKRLKEELEELRTRRFSDYQKSLTKMGKSLSKMNSSSS